MGIGVDVGKGVSVGSEVGVEVGERVFVFAGVGVTCEAPSVHAEVIINISNESNSFSSFMFPAL